MKNTFIIIFAFVFFSKSHSQNAIVEKSIFNIQTGFLGVWINNESRLNDNFTLRSEIGLDFGFRVYNFTNNDSNEFDFALMPVLSLEPRWYYNLDERKKKSKNTSNNSGNFLSLKTSYQPDWFIISDIENARVASNISAIPTWGIRRILGKHFNF